MEALILEPSLYTVKAILILDNDGDRLFAKYYDDTYPSVKEQKAFEKNIFNKTHRTDSEIALLEGLTVVYKSSIDLYFYVIGSSYENELMLMAVLNCLFDSLSQMLRKNVEKRALLENMEGLFLAVVGPPSKLLGASHSFSLFGSSGSEAPSRFGRRAGKHLFLMLSYPPYFLLNFYGLCYRYTSD
ncbi:COPI coat complex subunit zeta 1 [Rhinolophus ferrumequinum]|uniref:Coatomer subunit zeta n=1 Tax=Rhinolophus ferrumequinum TaxID=59479 RepID=A0A7J7WNX9_RHIFE|nr:COPI coat complex subunit zeta 1 [Rhinolophus ferrumequinum]